MMKSTAKLLIMGCAFMFFGLSAHAQNAEATVNTSVPLVKNTDNPTASPQVGKEVTVSFKNVSERPVAIFAGPKESIRDPKVVTYGGMSTNNKLYVRVNDVVCIMNVQKQPIACTVVKPGVTLVETNSSGTAISAK